MPFTPERVWRAIHAGASVTVEVDRTDPSTVEAEAVQPSGWTGTLGGA